MNSNTSKSNTSKSVTAVTKTKSNKQKGDEGEKFAYSVMTTIRYITEIHPRTFRPVYLPNGKKIMVSQDNDYHNSFDLKGERYDGMLYSQVKWMSSGETVRSDVKKARDKIDKNYPYYFPYQKIQVWMVWRDWVKNGNERRHKEWFFRVWERGKPIEHNENGYHFFEWPWKEITDEVKKEYESFLFPVKDEAKVSSYNSINAVVEDTPKTVLKLSENKRQEVK